MEEGSIITTVLSGLLTLFTTGGVVYLIVESIINRRKHHEEVKSQQVDNIERSVGYGVPMVQLYEEIDRIVAKKTDPILTKLSEATERIKDLEDNYCCYRELCEMRIRSKKDADRAEDIDHEKLRQIYGDS